MAVRNEGTGGRGRAIGAGLDAVAVTIPMSLGAAVILYGQIAPGHLAAGVLATCLAVVLAYALSAASARPVMLAARFFEAATLAAMVLQLAGQLQRWGLADTPALRLAMVCTIVGGAGVAAGALALLRAERFARFIPAPVYVGFANSVVVSLLISQTASLKRQVEGAGSVLPLALAGITMAIGLAVHRWRPRWPASMCALAAGSAAGALLALSGNPLPRLIEAGTWTLPLTVADVRTLADAALAQSGLALALARDALILGILVFLNNTVTGQFLAQGDDRTHERTRDKLLLAGAIAVGGAAGSPVVSGSPNVALVVSRSAVVTPLLMATVAAGVALLYVSTALTWVPVAALAGIFLFDAWTMWDRASARHARAWLLRRGIPANAREDLLVIGAVMLASLAVNMVAGLFVGLVLGLLLHAHRTTRTPVRAVLDGSQVRSRCARSPAEFAVLREHGGRLRVFELDSQQFFASGAQLGATLRAHLGHADVAVLDWSSVRDVDTSVAMVVARLEAVAARHRAVLLHAGAGQGPGSVASVLAQHVPKVRLCADLDRALQQAEDTLIARHRRADVPTPAEDPGAASLFRGMDADDRALLLSRMRPVAIDEGETVLRAGEPSNELVLVLDGTASVVVPVEGGGDVRLSGVRAGATVGEIGFLDRAPRSASVVADGAMRLLALDRAAFDRLAREQPHIVQRLLTNLSLDMAARLRHLTGLVATRPAAAPPR